MWGLPGCVLAVTLAMAGPAYAVDDRYCVGITNSGDDVVVPQCQTIDDVTAYCRDNDILATGYVASYCYPKVIP
jgi:hypothetical protein